MIKGLPKELLDKNLITTDQFNKIDPIVSGKIISVFYELRALLYLGVMLLATGLGILIYQNIGELGHLLSIVALTLIMIACFWYVIQKGLPYSNDKVKAPTPYFDYILLLGCLLTIAIQGYLQFQYQILDDNLGLSTLLSALLFFVMAYRFDHVGILSLGITALASFWSLSISPQKWYSSDFFSMESNLQITAIVFSSVLAGIAMGLDVKSIKKHFTFTYINFSSLIYFVGATAGLFMGDYYYSYLLLIYVGCVLSFFFAKQKRSFLFLLYVFVFGYIATTYLLSDLFFDREPELWFLYSFVSCGGFIFFIIRYRNYFTRKP
ncbi:MAG TPA: DUF2157 domain-containing protein [Cyclobacteriaceae bacterium]